MNLTIPVECLCTSEVLAKSEVHNAHQKILFINIIVTIIITIFFIISRLSNYNSSPPQSSALSSSWFWCHHQHLITIIMIIVTRIIMIITITPPPAKSVYWVWNPKTAVKAKTTALCSYPLVKMEIRDSIQILTKVPIFLQSNYFRQKYLEIASSSDSLLIYIWVRVDHSRLQQ